MDTKNSIETKGLKKKFTIKHTTMYGGTTKVGTKIVLNGVSFDVKKGEVLGIVGKNGSGKSTLLKILTKVMDPDEGDYEIQGKVASILELGMGFDPESSGRDNIRMKCGLYGLTKKEIEECMESIIAFSELGEQVDHPLRTYSSGMTAKLAFSVLIHVKCDVLIIDEVLSVGDKGFNSKCKMAFGNMKKAGKSILLASHNISILENMCDRVMWIDNGMVREIGDPQVVCYRYESNATDSFETVMSLAETGDLISINRAGVMLRDGIGISKDTKKAMEMFFKASKMGYAESQLNLANMKMAEGKQDEARDLLEKASLSGNNEAIITLMQINDDGDEKNKQLMDCVEKLAKSGNSRAMKLLADMLYSGTVFPKNQQSAIEWYKKSSEFNNSQSLFRLGLCTRDGIGVNKDANLGIEYLKRAAACGNNLARVELANTYRRGIGIERDVNEAIKWYTEAAMSGDMRSMLELGTIYRDGIGVEKDDSKSLKWMKQYAIIGKANCELELADILMKGFSGSKQYDCLEWFKRSFENGNIKAGLILGNIYRDGSLVKTDIDKAKEYYEEVSKCNNSEAEYELAMLLNKNSNPLRTDEEVVSLVKRSAMKNHRNSMIWLMNQVRIKNSDISTSIEIERMIDILSENGNLEARVFKLTSGYLDADEGLDRPL